MKYKLLTLVAVIILVFAFGIIGADAAVVDSGTCGDNVTWTLDDDGTLVIEGSGDMDNYFSSSATPWYSNYDSINSVVFTDGITSVGNYAFYNCRSVKSVDMPDSLVSIGFYAFHNTAWYSNQPYGFIVLNDYILYSYKYQTSVYDLNIEIPVGIKVIGDGAFSACKKLKSVILPDTITHIGDSAFSSCTNLASINIPDGVESIGISSFSACSSLTSISLPDSITDIGNNAFGSCSNLTTINLPSSLTIIQDNTFDGCSRLSGVSLPANLTSIGGEAFEGCSSITGLYLPKSVVSIGESAFAGCSALKSINIPDNVTTISNRLFLGCSALKKITIPDGVTEIESNAFYNCNKLTTVTVPDSVTSIGNGAFGGCTGLTKITLPFVGSQRGITETADSVFGYIFGTTNTTGDNVVSQLYSKGYSNYYCIPDSLTTVVITDETTIPYGAFCGCEYVTRITIPYGVTSIGDFAFANCDNMWLSGIPDSVTSIGGNAFVACKKLTSITIPDSVKYIGDGAYSLCNNIEKIYAHIAQESMIDTDWADEIVYYYVVTYMYEDGTKTKEYVNHGDCANLDSIIAPDGYRYEYIVNGEIWDGKSVTSDVTVNIKSIKICLADMEILYFNKTQDGYEWSVNIVADSDEPMNGNLFVAVYSFDGSIQKIYKQSVDISNMQTNVIGKTTASDVQYIKLFLFSDDCMLKPLCKAEIISSF